MKPSEAETKLIDAVRVRHFAYSTEKAYVGWLRRYMVHVATLPKSWSPRLKIEAFLTSLAKSSVAPSTQNQAFNRAEGRGASGVWQGGRAGALLPTLYIAPAPAPCHTPLAPSPFWRSQ